MTSLEKNQPSRYGSFLLRAECNHCGISIPFAGPVQHLECPACKHQLSYPPELWRSVLSRFEDELRHTSFGTGISSTVMMGAGQYSFKIVRIDPECEKCGTAFPVDELPIGDAKNFTCAKCGDPAATYPVPQWLVNEVPTARQIYTIDPDPAFQRNAHVPTAEVSSGPKPVVMACPQSTGSLKVVADSERLLTCKYCEATVFLPDEIWRHLHPVQVPKQWFVRFEGKTPQDLEYERTAAEARKVREARALKLHHQQMAAEARQRAADAFLRAGKALTAAYLPLVAAHILWWLASFFGLLPSLPEHSATAVSLGRAGLLLAIALGSAAVLAKPAQARNPQEKDMVFSYFFFPVFLTALIPPLGILYGVILVSSKKIGGWQYRTTGDAIYTDSSFKLGPEQVPLALIYFGFAAGWLLAIWELSWIMGAAFLPVPRLSAW